MRRSIATVSMSGTLREKLEAIAAARFDGFELFENDLIYFNGSPAEVGALAADLGLSCDLYQPFRDFEGMPDAVLQRNLDRAERKFDVMQALGAQLMLVCSNTSANVIADEQRMAAQLYALAERAAQRNLRIGFEALAWGRAVKLYSQAWSIVKRADHPHLGLMLDRIELFDPPAVPKLAGMSFLEFAVDEDSGRALGALIERLGFRYAGKHRSKHVTLLRQGDINLILNAEPNSPARVHFDERGPSICATGLRTDDPVRALNRATALQCARVDTALGPRELRIPAIRAPDGGAIYFVSVELGPNGPFDIDFELDAGDTRRHLRAGLQSIDHIAFGLPEDELDTWVLFCRAVLGMKPGDSLELSDPYGLIRSCGVASADRSVRFVLNVSLSQRTRTARTVSAIGGGSVHHIALGCADLVATVVKLLANGVEFVPISPNYYDDLLARSLATVATMSVQPSAMW